MTFVRVLTWGCGKRIEEVGLNRDLGYAVIYAVGFNSCIQFSASASLLKLQ